MTSISLTRTFLSFFSLMHSTACSMLLHARKMHSHIVIYLHGAISCFHNAIADMNFPLENLSAGSVIINLSKSFIYIAVHSAVVVNVWQNFLCADLISTTNETNVNIPQMADTLFERSANASWVVVFKALSTTHHICIYGNEVRRYLLINLLLLVKLLILKLTDTEY